MKQTIWTRAELTPEQARTLKEAEATLGSGVLLAFKGSGIAPRQLTPSQLDCLRGLEQRLGLVLVALQPG